jgi:hypothetical protein
MGQNSVVGLRIGEAQLRSESNITSALSSCASCSAGTKGSGPASINIANLTMDLTLEMRVSKNWNPTLPYRKLYDRNVAYKTKAKPIGGLKKGIVGDYDSAKQQLKDWFQQTTSVALDDGAAQDILDQLFKQAQEKEDQIIASAKASLDSGNTQTDGYLPPASQDFCEIFRQVCAFEDWDSNLGVTIRHINVEINVAITPTISDFCESDDKKGTIEVRVGQLCGYFNAEWQDDNGGFQLYVKDYVEPPKNNVNSDYFSTETWAQYDTAITNAQWQSSSIRNSILQAALDSQNNPGAVYTVPGGFEGNINGFAKVKIITDLSDEPQTRMSMSVGLAIGGGVGSDYMPRPFLEGVWAEINLGSPSSFIPNINALGELIGQMINPRPPQLVGLGDSLDQLNQDVANTPDGTVGNPINTIGSGTTTPTRIEGGTISNDSNSGSGTIRVNPPGTITEPVTPRPRSR